MSLALRMRPYELRFKPPPKSGSPMCVYPRRRKSWAYVYVPTPSRGTGSYVQAYGCRARHEVVHRVVRLPCAIYESLQIVRQVPCTVYEAVRVRTSWGKSYSQMSLLYELGKSYSRAAGDLTTSWHSRTLKLSAAYRSGMAGRINTDRPLPAFVRCM